MMTKDLPKIKGTVEDSELGLEIAVQLTLDDCRARGVISEDQGDDFAETYNRIITAMERGERFEAYASPDTIAWIKDVTGKESEDD